MPAMVSNLKLFIMLPLVFPLESLSYKFVGALITLCKSPTRFWFDVYSARVIKTYALLTANLEVNISVFLAWDGSLVVH